MYKAVNCIRKSASTRQSKIMLKQKEVSDMRNDNNTNTLCNMQRSSLICMKLSTNDMSLEL